jgi:SAM-dependent methyltransferase
VQSALALELKLLHHKCEMKNICEICNQAATLGLNETYKGIDVVVCKACGLVWNRNMNDEPEQVEFYTKYNRSGGTLPRRYLVSMLARAASALEFLDNDLKAGMKHLDVGCAEGTLLALTRAHGLEVQGLEIDLNHSRFARETRGLLVLPMTLDAAPLEPNSFDLVSLVHVVEHLVHPIEVLDSARNLLRDGGLLYVEVPNMNQPLPGSRHFFRPKHNFYFTANTLKSLVSKAGFSPVRVGYSSRDGSVQLLCAKGAAEDKPQWRDDARKVRARVLRERNRHYLLLHTLFTHYLRLQWMKRVMLQRYGHLLPELASSNKTDTPQ